MINEQPRNLLLRKNNHNWPKNIFKFTMLWKISSKFNSRVYKRVYGLLSENYNAENYTNVSWQWVINCRLSQRAVSLITVAHSKMFHSRCDRERSNILNGKAVKNVTSFPMVDHSILRAPFRDIEKEYTGYAKLPIAFLSSASLESIP